MACVDKSRRPRTEARAELEKRPQPPRTSIEAVETKGDRGRAECQAVRFADSQRYRDGDIAALGVFVAVSCVAVSQPWGVSRTANRQIEPATKGIPGPGEQDVEWPERGG